MYDISVGLVQEDYVQESIGFVCVGCRCTSISVEPQLKSRYLGNSSETTELIANVSAFYKAARSNHPGSVDE